MAAEVLAQAGVAVDVFDAMPSAGRKFLMAGKGGLNITHAEPLEAFVTRYSAGQARVADWLRSFPPQAIRDWMAALGVQSFVGSSGRVFPNEMKAAPLLRAWVQHLRNLGVRMHMRHRWQGWDAHGALRLQHAEAEFTQVFSATVLALGGGSWARLGSDGAWVPLLRAQGVPVADLLPSNCGFECAWSEVLKSRFAGQPLKPVVLRANLPAGGVREVQGEVMLTDYGIEGGAVYALSAELRAAIMQQGEAVVLFDLLPGLTIDDIARRLAQGRGGRSLSEHWRRTLNLHGAKAALLRECAAPEELQSAQRTATLLKALPLTLRAMRPLDEAISTAGGVRLDALDETLMLRQRPGVFCAGEMLDWDAPTGGYLLSACLASGYVAGQGAVAYLRGRG